MVALQIPESLAEMARQVPGLDDRVKRFIRLEIERYRLRQAQFSPAALDLVARAKAAAEEKKLGGFDRKSLATRVRTALDELSE